MSAAPTPVDDKYIAAVGLNRRKISPIRGTSVSAAQIPAEIEYFVAIEKKRDILIATYNPRETMFTDQTGKFPHASSQGNNYQIAVHDIDSNSTWVEPMKNRKEGEMILARQRALKQMQLQGIVTKHQVLENEISAAYKDEILSTDTTYQLVPPNDHHKNTTKKAI